MKLLHIVFFFSVSSIVFGNNYIDNPNFDQYKEGWFLEGTHHCVEWRHYEEDSFGISTYDKALSAPVASDVSFFYDMKDVPANVPLFVKVELGLEDVSNVKVELILSEETKPDTWRPYCALRSEGFLIKEYLAWKNQRFDERQLLLKKFQIKDSNQWVAVNSDFPVYKNGNNTLLRLKIKFTRNSKSKSGRFLLNYAQVGTDSQTLGGRGGRMKEKSTIEVIEDYENTCNLKGKGFFKQEYDKIKCDKSWTQFNISPLRFDLI